MAPCEQATYWRALTGHGREAALRDAMEERLRASGTGARAVIVMRSLHLGGKSRGGTGTSATFPGSVFLHAPRPLGPALTAELRRLPGCASLRELAGPDARLLRWLLSWGGALPMSDVHFDASRRLVATGGPLVGLQGSVIRVDRRKRRATVRVTLCGSPEEFDLCYRLTGAEPAPPVTQ